MGSPYEYLEKNRKTGNTGKISSLSLLTTIIGLTITSTQNLISNCFSIIPCIHNEVKLKIKKRNQISKKSKS